MKTFSIIFPTRKRIGKLCNCLTSILVRTEKKDEIEVLIGYDDDDTVTKMFKAIFEKEFASISVKFFEFKQKINKHGYYNKLFKHSIGENIITLNDDCEFRTVCWDAVARGKIETHAKPDGIYYGFIEDLLENHSRRHGTYCCFPLLSRKTVDVLGFLQSEEFLGGGADIYIGNIMHGINRVIDMRDIVIDHISFHNYKGMETDSTYEEAWAGYKANPLKRQKPTTEVGEAIEKLRRYMDAH